MRSQYHGVSSSSQTHERAASWRWNNECKRHFKWKLTFGISWNEERASSSWAPFSSQFCSHPHGPLSRALRKPISSAWGSAHCFSSDRRHTAQLPTWQAKQEAGNPVKYDAICLRRGWRLFQSCLTVLAVWGKNVVLLCPLSSKPC